MCLHVNNLSQKVKQGTLQQTNYQVTTSTAKLKFCELQPRSAVRFESSNKDYRLFLPSLSLFHQFSYLSPLKSPKKVTFCQKPMSLLSPFWYPLSRYVSLPDFVYITFLLLERHLIVCDNDTRLTNSKVVQRRKLIMSIAAAKV